MTPGRRPTAELPTYEFPLTGRLPAELLPPKHFGPVGRWCWRRDLRRSNFAKKMGTATKWLNEWFAETLDRGGKAFRIIVWPHESVELDLRLREIDENLPEAPHLLEMMRARLLESPEQYQRLSDSMTDREVWIGLPSGEWLKQERSATNWSELLIEQIMSLAPNGAFILTRTGDRPPLLVTVRYLEGELRGLEVSWEPLPAMRSATLNSEAAP